jgi:hypothetical protein
MNQFERKIIVPYHELEHKYRRLHTNPRPVAKLVMLDLLTAQEQFRASGQKLTLLQCWREMQQLLEGFLQGVVDGTQTVSEEKMVTIHVNQYHIARFELS